MKTISGFVSQSLHTIPVLITVFVLLSGMSLPAQKYVPGRIYDSLSAGRNSACSYSLYIPLNFVAADSLPVVILFDPLARSGLTMQKFRSAADSTGCVILCSRESRNGLQIDQYDYYYSTILNHLQSDAGINPSRVIIGGFSGGARVATYLALRYRADGVLACGAGLNYTELPPGLEPDLFYFGIVGQRDMNFQEMLVLDQYLRERNINHLILTPDIGHEWPSDSILCLAVQALVRKTLGSGSSHVAGYLQQEAAKFLAHGDPVAAGRYYGYLLEAFPEAASDTLSAYLQYLITSPEFARLKIFQERLREEELNEQIEIDQQFSQLVFHRAISDSITAQLRSRIRNLHSLSHNRNRLQAQKALRLLGLISHHSVVIGSELYEHKDYRAAEVLFSLWTETSPHNAWAYYYLAMAAARNDRELKACRSLQTALQEGLSPRSLLVSEPAFEHLVSHKKYQKLLRDFPIDE